MRQPGTASDQEKLIRRLNEAEVEANMISNRWVYDNSVCKRHGLTRREVEVLTWVAGGKSNTEIGLILGTSPRTVGKHLEHIFEKLGVETRTAAAVRALALTSSQ
ncbi:LuxR family two component transcriptional regulator [Candidatus Methylomirabilis lanthanidiphila]|uniref:LuxR family two component transcriptional regulator n=1 Tax=Candidatus Methylomirabilis lanthanidiphila TaxID=2211376 RepID=A0A564ZFS4_9BACT|nr:LuxR family two component transcriptional regulator [Candidatus Methylomirabilis lanthanidiphila]